MTSPLPWTDRVMMFLTKEAILDLELDCNSSLNINRSKLCCIFLALKACSIVLVIVLYWRNHIENLDWLDLGSPIWSSVLIEVLRLGGLIVKALGGLLGFHVGIGIEPLKLTLTLYGIDWIGLNNWLKGNSSFVSTNLVHKGYAQPFTDYVLGSLSQATLTY